MRWANLVKTSAGCVFGRSWGLVGAGPVELWARGAWSGPLSVGNKGGRGGYGPVRCIMWRTRHFPPLIARCFNIFLWALALHSIWPGRRAGVASGGMLPRSRDVFAI